MSTNLILYNSTDSPLRLIWYMYFLQEYGPVSFTYNKFI